MMYKSQRSHYLVLIAVAFALLLASSLIASPPPTTTFYLDDPGPTGANLAGVYTSPYLGQVNYPTSAVVPVICDDFADNSYVPEEWTAYVTSLSTVTSGPTDTYLKWGTSGSVSGSDPALSWTLTQAQAYDVAAILAIDILQSSGSSQQDYSFALWGLFDSTDAFAQLNGFSGDQTNAENYLNTAITDVENNSINGGSISSYLGNYHVTIYSYDAAGNPSGPSCGGGPCPSSPPQEFITVTTPEASTPIQLAVDLLGFVALVGFLRKRVSQSI